MASNALIFWKQFVETGHIDTADLNPVINRSWQRCRDLKVCYDRSLGTDVLTGERFRDKLEKNIQLVKAAIPVMNDLFGVLRGFGFMVILADCEGTILKTLVDEGFSRQAGEVMLREGANWGEQIQGTNAIGTSLAEHKPVNIIGHEHYVMTNHNIACSAVPIFGVDGSIIGTLDATGEANKGSKRISGMVGMAVRSIERELQMAHLQQGFDEYKSCYRNIIDLIREGTIMVDETGMIKEISPVAGQLLGINPDEFLGVSYEELFTANKIWIMDSSVFDTGELSISPKHGSSLVSARARRIYGSDGEAKGLLALLSPGKFPAGKSQPQGVEQPVVGTGCEVRFTFNHIIGQSEQIRDVISVCRRVSKSSSTVLLTGATGSGKEMLAQAIHHESPRSGYPFIAVNCAAIPAELVESELFGYEEGAFTGAMKGGSTGKFELADGGTIFLDEIGDMPLRAQVSLLRVLQEKQLCRVGGYKPKQIDVRVIAATHRNLTEMVADAKFREDLFFRLNVVNINIPALRERPEDIELLANFFLQKFKNELGSRLLDFSPEAMASLREYTWPGNVRELENVIEGLVNTADGNIVTPNNLPARIIHSRQNPAEPETRCNLKDIERAAIIQAVADCRGSIVDAAVKLGIGRSTMYRKVKEFEINLKNFN